MVSQKYLGNTHQLGGSSHLSLPVSLYFFWFKNAIFLLKIHILLAALAVVAAVAVTTLIDLKIQLRYIFFKMFIMSKRDRLSFSKLKQNNDDEHKKISSNMISEGSNKNLMMIIRFVLFIIIYHT